MSKEENESWNQQKKMLKQKFIKLTNNELFVESTKPEKWLNKLQIKFGMTREELLKLLSSIENK